MRDIKGNFHRWHDEISLEPEGTEERLLITIVNESVSLVCLTDRLLRNLIKPFLHILPYVDLDFDLL